MIAFAPEELTPRIVRPVSVRLKPPQGIKTCAWVGAMALAAFAAGGVQGQQTSQEPPPSSVKLTGGISSTTYTDSASATCEQTNANNPYVGMNPLACYGEMAPQASNGACDLGGWQVLKHVGETCYYCAPINPPIVGIIVPMDQVGAAESQGWGCGLDQADACMAICRGGSTYTPPPGTNVKGGPGLPPTPAPPQGGPPPNYAPQPGPAGGQGYVPGPNPCIAGGGYNYCDNGPGARLPAGCSCSAATPDPDRLKNPESPGALPLPPSVRQALESGAAQMDQMLDDKEAYALAGLNRFFKCLSEEIDADMKFLGQPGYVPAANIAGALHFGAWQYMSTPPYTNNVQMFQAAQQELNNFKQDPACATAKIVPAAVAAVVTHVAGAAAEATAVQKAGNEAMLLAKTEQGAAAALEKEAGSGLQGKSIGSPNGRTTPGLILMTEAEVDAACGENICVAQAIAKDLSAATGEPLSGVAPFQGNAALQILEAGGTVSPPVRVSTLNPLLESLYRNVKLKGPALSKEIMDNQASGVPTQIASAQVLSDSLQGVPGARAIMIVEYTPTASVPNPILHAFNGIVDAAGSMVYSDATQPNVTGAALFNNVTKIYMYRTQ